MIAEELSWGEPNFPWRKRGRKKVACIIVRLGIMLHAIKRPSPSGIVVVLVGDFLQLACLCKHYFTLELIKWDQLPFQLGIPLEPFSSPLSVSPLNSQLLIRILYRTKPVHLMLSGNHCEYLEFHRFSTPQTPIIFGSTWLETHDLHINWTDRRIESWSFFCLSHCLDYASCQLTSVQPVLCQICHWCTPNTMTWDKFFCKEKMLFPS